MDTLLPLLGFAFVTSITPGPNNLMLASSGVAFGMRRTLPHMLGVPVGFTALLIVSGLGTGALIATVPAAGLALKIAGTCYLAYLTWIMRHALDPERAAMTARPIRFVEAALFQFANPKAWIMALTAVSVFVPEGSSRWLGLLGVSSVFVLVNVPCILTWVVLGASARRLVARERQRRLLAAVILVLMVYTIVAIWL